MSDKAAVKRWRYYVSLHGKKRRDPEPTRRRVQALCALGWSISEQSRRTGIQREHLREIAEGVTPAVGPHVRLAVAALYDVLSGSTPAPSRYATRTRNDAARKCWVPPLAWDDIDNDTNPADLDYYTERMSA